MEDIKNTTVVSIEGMRIDVNVRRFIVRSDLPSRQIAGF
jgi:hypothetical protein